ncbi:hypothetical protein B0H13DRAFT_1877073 [Mycena leptocephala]|nr:hypothetical protein B0H13DRAFT_1877073 [Mycena leptocephala]
MSEPSLNVTHPALHVRNASDVLVVLEAVRRGILPLITLRLSGSERDQLRSGNVFVWEESTEDGGLVTKQSVRRVPVLPGEIEVTEEEREAKAMRRVQRICNPGASVPPPRRNQRPSKSGGLTKQTYSFLVRLPGTYETRKWHAVAYSVWPDRASLPVVEDYPALRTIRVPVGIFARSKASDTVTMYPPANSADARYGSCADRPQIAAAPGPSRVVFPNNRGREDLPASGERLPSFNPGRNDRTDLILPPISALKPPSWDQSPMRTISEVPVYLRQPVSQEDRRILDSFRLGL